MADNFGSGGEQGNTVAVIPEPGGGYEIVTDQGAVYAENGAQYYGGTNTGIGGDVGRHIVSAKPLPGGGYQLVNAQGQTYNFGPQPGQANLQGSGGNPLLQAVNYTPPTPDSTASSISPLTGTQQDADSIIKAVLSQYGLDSLSDWALNEIKLGASADQVTQDMTATPQFKARFPAIAARVSAGLPPLSPADYVNYENTMKQMESQYGLPTGALTSKDFITEALTNDVGAPEMQERVQKGFQAVAYSPPEVRQAFAGMFGVGGDGALAHYFTDTSRALPLLEQQATAAQISGTAGIGGVNIGQDDAMKLAALGVNPSSITSVVGDLNKQAPLFDATIHEGNNLTAGGQGVEAAFGLNATAEQQLAQRQQEREGAFSGGGSAYMDQHGARGIGGAKPF